MLPDHCRELLTAFVDGEISNRQRRQVLRLLRRSREARSLLQRLQEDSQALRHLPRVHLEADLSPRVLRTIGDRRLQRARRQARPASRVPAWSGLAAAAAVLFVVGVASYSYFSLSLGHQANRAAQTSKAPPSPTPSAKSPEGPSVAKTEIPPVKPGPVEKVKPPETPRTNSTEVVQNPVVKPVPPSVEVRSAPPKEEQALTSKDMEMFKIKEIGTVALPTTFKFTLPGQDLVHHKLLAELRKDTAFRLELPCRDGTKAFERLHEVFKSQNITLVIDQAAQRRLKQPSWKTNYVLYMEDFTPEQLARLLQLLAEDDKKAVTRRPADVRFAGHLIVTPMTDLDHKELSQLMGVDPTRPGSVRVKDKVLERSALVLAYNPVRPSPGSPEVKRYLDTRKPIRPGTVQVLLVLRGVL